LLLDMLGTKAQAGIGSIPCIRSGTSFGSGARQSLGPNPCPIHPERRLAMSYIYIYMYTIDGMDHGICFDQFHLVRERVQPDVARGLGE
jgi:hypothetical protein